MRSACASAPLFPAAFIGESMFRVAFLCAYFIMPNLSKAIKAVQQARVSSPSPVSRASLACPGRPSAGSPLFESLEDAVQSIKGGRDPLAESSRAVPRFPEFGMSSQMVSPRFCSVAVQTDPVQVFMPGEVEAEVRCLLANTHKEIVEQCDAKTKQQIGALRDHYERLLDRVGTDVQACRDIASVQRDMSVANCVLVQNIADTSDVVKEEVLVDVFGKPDDPTQTERVRTKKKQLSKAERRAKRVAALVRDAAAATPASEDPLSDSGSYAINVVGGASAAAPSRFMGHTDMIADWTETKTHKSKFDLADRNRKAVSSIANRTSNCRDDNSFAALDEGYKGIRKSRGQLQQQQHSSGSSVTGQLQQHSSGSTVTGQLQQQQHRSELKPHAVAEALA